MEKLLIIIQKIKYEKRWRFGNSGRFGLLLAIGFDYEDFKFGFSCLRLPGLHSVKVDGFWSLSLNFLVAELTLNITDK